jgi:ubiquinone/menaquinone biosynthesis C-methylase UbiE
MSEGSYIIRGGVEGRQRLRLLSRILRPTTLALFDRVGVRPGMNCVDVGCGGGDVTLDLARRVGPSGRVVGVDIDATKLDLARQEAETERLANVEFRRVAIDAWRPAPEFDLVYSRFLLTHLNDPTAAVRTMRQGLRPGGVIVVEDIDFAGHFCFPECPAFSRYIQLYIQTVLRRGGDPYIGPKLPGMLLDAGFERVDMNVVHPVAIDGDVKLLNPVTMENIADASVAAGLASRPEVDQVIAGLYECARDGRTVMSTARVVQTWGSKSQEPRA